MDIFSIINNLITYSSSHQIVIYLILFLGSFLEKTIGFYLIIFGGLLFITGSIFAGIGILNIWVVVFLFYTGSFLGDNVSYFLGKKYGIRLYKYFKDRSFLKKYINKENYDIGSNFLKEYGVYSIFFARFLGPAFWIIPFLSGISKLSYKTFLKYDLLSIIIWIGQFVVIGYFTGIHYKTILDLFLKYIFILLFLGVMILFSYFYLRRKKYISTFKKRWNSNKKKLFIITIKHFTLITITTTLIFLIFLLYLSFVYKSPHFSSAESNKIISLDDSYLNNCKNLNTYYFDSDSDIIQPINIVITSNKDISNIIGNDWIRVGIFKEKKLSFKDFIASVKNKTLPVSDLYMNNFPQDSAYQYKKNSITKREHIRFWNFSNKKNNKQKIYLGSISNDNGLTFKFYNHFLTPLHEINQNVDSSRDFFNNYLSNQKNTSCRYIQTNCIVKKNIQNDEQQYFTDGKILSCSTN